MTGVVALALALVLAAIALLHAYWGLGGLWPASGEPELVRRVIGDPRLKRMPPPAICLLVAAMIAVTALWPLLLAGWFGTVAAGSFARGVGTAIMAVFLLRGIAGFLPTWRRKHPLEPFATLDGRMYSPLCLAVAAGYAVLLFQGV